MKINLKSIFGIKQTSTDKTTVDKEEIEYDKHVDFYYTNLINSLILCTYDSKKLEDMAPILINPLNELYEELEYAFTPVCFETVFRVGLIDNLFKNELLKFKNEVDEIPSEIWGWEFIDSHETWFAIRKKSNFLLDKIGVSSRTYNDDYTTVYDNKGNIVHKGKKTTLKILMKFKHSVLSWFALLIIGVSLWLIVRMFIIPTYPTYLYFLSLGYGILLLLIDSIIRSFVAQKKRNLFVIQFCVVGFTLYFGNLTLFPSYTIENRNFPDLFEGPFIILYEIDGYPKLEESDNKIVINIPNDGVLKTSSSFPNKTCQIKDYLKGDYKKEMVITSGVGTHQSSDCPKVIKFSFGAVSPLEEKNINEEKFEKYKDSILETTCK